MSNFPRYKWEKLICSGNKSHLRGDMSNFPRFKWENQICSGRKKPIKEGKISGI